MRTARAQDTDATMLMDEGPKEEDLFKQLDIRLHPVMLAS